MARLLLRVWKFCGRWPALQRWILRLVNPAFLVGVVAVIFDDAGRVVLFHHTYRRQFNWSLPGGWLKRGEDPARALAREVHEETTLKVEVLAPVKAVALEVAPQFEVIYLARLTGGEFHPSAEVDAVGRFTADDLPPLKPYQRELVLAALAARDAGRLPAAPIFGETR